jgi:hypothetical protein
LECGCFRYAGHQGEEEDEQVEGEYGEFEVKCAVLALDVKIYIMKYARKMVLR